LESFLGCGGLSVDWVLEYRWGEVRAGLSPNGSEKQACRNQVSSLWDEQG
jgi:hypothetical protein